MKWLVLWLLLCFPFQGNHVLIRTLETELMESVRTDSVHRIQGIFNETIATRFKPPAGYDRVPIVPNSFASYLRNFKLQNQGALVYLFNGELKSRQDVHAAVLDISIGHRDLQQCADAIIRLRAEYLFNHNRFDDISFNFTNGFQASYKKWRAGQRIKVVGNKVSWTDGGQFGVGRRSFLKYLDMVFSYAGTLSLSKELYRIVPDHMEIGDVFIQGGSPGHAVIVVDMVKNQQGDFLFLLAQSYMPAQSIHVLNNLEAPSLSPWYSLKETRQLVTPEWVFESNNLKRFKK